jgi:hypothetical protein
VTGAICKRGEARRPGRDRWRPLAEDDDPRALDEWVDDTWMEQCSTCGSHVVNLRLEWVS